MGALAKKDIEIEKLSKVNQEQLARISQMENGKDRSETVQTQASNTT